MRIVGKDGKNLQGTWTGGPVHEARSSSFLGRRVLGTEISMKLGNSQNLLLEISWILDLIFHLDEWTSETIGGFGSQK